MKIKVNGRGYQVESMADMKELPKVAEHIKAIYYIKGKLGAFLALHERHNGTFYTLNASSLECKEARSVII